MHIVHNKRLTYTNFDKQCFFLFLRTLPFESLGSIGFFLLSKDAFYIVTKNVYELPIRIMKNYKNIKPHNSILE